MHKGVRQEKGEGEGGRKEGGKGEEEGWGVGGESTCS